MKEVDRNGGKKSTCESATNCLGMFQGQPSLIYPLFALSYLRRSQMIHL